MKGNERKCDCRGCKGKMLPAIDIVFWEGKSYPMDVIKCDKCGEVAIAFEEAERIRKLIHPTILERISRLFSRTEEKIANLSFFKGRVL